ncbi:ATP-dependent metallopeptidase FtsH/Yme1/Tma family protein, partial [Rossellomorea marisflavi]
MKRIFSNTIFYLLVFLLIIGVVSFFNNNNEPTKTIDYSTFINKLEDNQVKSFSVQPSRGVYELKGQMRDAKKDEYFVTHILSTDGKLMDRINDAASGTTGDNALKKVDVEILEAKETNGWISVFTTIIPFVIIFILFFFLLNQAQGGGSRVMNFGKSK